MAVAILKLQEEHRIDLDAPITTYLPEKYSRMIDKAASITVRHLLNHTSGMNDYLESPVYISYVLQHPDYLFSSEEIMGYIKGKKQRFAPGSKYQYCNTNFHVLALIADKIAGDHNELIRQQILKPLGLTNTYYRQIFNQPFLPNSYLDRFSTGIVENVSKLQQTSITFSKGDDGIIATPVDAINFLRGLMEGKLLSDSSLKQMLTWVPNWEGKPTYGMGIFQVNYFGQVGYGHGGAGAGAGCGLYYFPGKQLYVFLGTNIGTLVDGPIVQQVDDLKQKVLEIVLK
jgi:D-alanyl-D-alanine carboxypeptidase